MPTADKRLNLYVKSFFASSIPAAMEQARHELGSDALLLNSREAPPEARHLGDYEVVFGTLPETSYAAVRQPAPPSCNEELRNRIYQLRQVMRSEIGLALGLTEAGVDPELADSIERAVRRRMNKGTVLEIGRPYAAVPEPPQTWQSATAEEIRSRFEVAPEIGRVTALVGPPGAGKTTTLVKLAITQCLQRGRAVHLLTTDTFRIGGAEQLRTYAAILGAPFQAVDSTAALAQAIENASPQATILIDTPGYSAAMQHEFGGELASFLRRRQDIDTHMILTASMNGPDLHAAADRFAAFAPQKLIFTRLDETTSFGAAFSEAVRTSKPMSFFCHGQSVPEDIHAAAKDPVVDSLARELLDALQAVA